jgi:hypothetical protein
MPPKGYKSINIPEDMYAEIKIIIKQNRSHYTSMDEFAKSALRVEMRHYPLKNKSEKRK